MANNDPYNILGLNKNANDEDIKKAYRKKALKEHPDKGGNVETFKEIQNAYDILSNKEKREKYDRFGHRGLDDTELDSGYGNGYGSGSGSGSGYGHGSPSSIFEAFFRQNTDFGFNGQQQHRGQKKDPPVKRNLSVSLKDLYLGKTMKLSITRNKIQGGSITCSDCGGRGVKVQTRQLGPGMIQQMQSRCGKCNGNGSTCNYSKETNIVELCIERGYLDGADIKFSEMADENINSIPGDIIFTLNQKPDPIFKRKNNDLLIVRDISIYDVFVDYEFILDLLDDTRVLIKVKANTIKSPSYKLDNGLVGFVNEPFVLSAEGLGMPKVNTGGLFFGDLFVIFNIVFPNGEFDESKIQHKSYSSAEVDSCETYYLKVDSINRFGR
jgi:DnaJ family protein A protein 2